MKKKKTSSRLDYILYRIKYLIARRFGWPHPIHLDLELTNRCNQKCISCWHSDPSKRKFKLEDMRLVRAQRVLKEARKTGCLSVKLNLRGEPFMYNPDCFKRVVSYAKRLGYLDIMVNTNATVESSLFVSLVESGLTKVIISVDSFSLKTYKKIHGGNYLDYLNIFETLAYLKKQKELGKLKTKVVLNYHINELNKHEVKNGLPVGYEWYDCFPIKMKYTMPREGKDISIKHKRKRKKYCPHLNTRLTVMSNSKVYPCCVAYNEPKDIMLSKVSNDMKEVWEDNKRKAIREKIRKGKAMFETCANCTSGEVWK